MGINRSSDINRVLTVTAVGSASLALVFAGMVIGLPWFRILTHPGVGLPLPLVQLVFAVVTALVLLAAYRIAVPPFRRRLEREHLALSFRRRFAAVDSARPIS